jgi:phosphate transport system protein
MSHHFQEQLSDLRTRLSRMSASVQQIVEESIEAIDRLDARLARRVIDADAQVDEDEVQVEESAINLLALHQPAAVDLRLITTIIKVNSDLERIADCAVNIAQRVVPLSGAEILEGSPSDDLGRLARSVAQMLRDSIKAFNSLDEALARQVLSSDDIVDAIYSQIVQDALLTLESLSAHRDTHTLLANIMVAKNLERIGDHCTNIAEDVLYVCGGKIVRHRSAG